MHIKCNTHNRPVHSIPMYWLGDATENILNISWPRNQGIISNQWFWQNKYLLDFNTHKYIPSRLGDLVCWLLTIGENNISKCFPVLFAARKLRYQLFVVVQPE
jgi:membrane protein YqaA with SNARE-associated domain